MKLPLETNGVSVPFFQIDAHKLIDKSMMFYGSPNGGKTNSIKHIIREFIRTKLIPKGFIFSPTAKSNEDFSTTFPPKALLSSKDLTMLKDIVDNQRMKSAIYTRSRNVKSLFEILSKWSKQNNEQILVNLLTKYHSLARIKAKLNLKKTQRIMTDSMIEGIVKQEGKLTRSFRKYIKNNEYRMKTSGIYNKKETGTIEYVTVNPKCLIVLDDCTHILKDKATKSLLEEICYNGRHYHLTVIIVSHDDAKISPSLRDAIKFSFFVDREALEAGMTKQNTLKDTKRKKYIGKIKEYLFTVPFRHLVVAKELPPHIFYSKSDNMRLASGSFGSDAFTTFCKLAESKSASEYGDVFK